MNPAERILILESTIPDPDNAGVGDYFGSSPEEAFYGK